jgi:hypothetical protein
VSSFVCVDGCQSATYITWINKASEVTEHFPLECFKKLEKINKQLDFYCGPGSSIDIATGNVLDGPGTEYRCGRDFPHLSILNLESTQPHVKWVPRLFPWKRAAGV